MSIIDQAPANTAQVATIFEAFGRGDVGFILGELTDDVRFVSHLDPAVPWAGEFVGKEQVAGYFQAMGTAVEISGHPVTSTTAEDDRVVAKGEVNFRVRETGRTGSSTWVYIFTMQDGKVAGFEQFNDTGLVRAFVDPRTTQVA